jgi:hypothetical protein
VYAGVGDYVRKIFEVSLSPAPPITETLPPTNDTAIRKIAGDASEGCRHTSSVITMVSARRGRRPDACGKYSKTEKKE